MKRKDSSPLRFTLREYSYHWLCAAGAVLFIGGLVVLPIRKSLGGEPVSFQDIEESLTCQCGCGLTVHSCNHLQCGSAIPLREEIREQMQQGKDKNAILAYFSSKYGEKILSSPTAKGFNLVAWILPFVMVAVGGIFVGVVVMRWTARGRAHQAPQTAAPAVASEYQKIIEQELKDFEG